MYRLLQCLTVAVRLHYVEGLAAVLAFDFGPGEIPKLKPDLRWDQEEVVLSICRSNCRRSQRWLPNRAISFFPDEGISSTKSGYNDFKLATGTTSTIKTVVSKTSSTDRHSINTEGKTQSEVMVPNFLTSISRSMGSITRTPTVPCPWPAEVMNKLPIMCERRSIMILL